MTTFRLLSLVRSELSIIRLPTLTTRPPSRPGSTRVSMRTFLPIDVRKVSDRTFLLHLGGKLEVHLDTDEGNACDLPHATKVELFK